jgi:HK97 family phage prohead protease
VPYFISQTAKGWDTVKEDGTVLGSHPDKKKAIAQMVALSIAEKMPAGGELKRDVVAQVGITDLDDTLIVNGALHQDYFDWLDHQGVKLYVITGRDESQRNDTIDQLDEFGVQYRELIMRPSVIPAAGTNDWKGSVAKQLISDGENVKFAVDNDPVARAAYKKAGVQEVLDPKTISYDTKRDYEVEPVAEEALEPTKEYLASELSCLLSNVVLAKFLAHGAHWNVKGILFSQFHEFFEEIYQDYDSAIDPIAENIRKLDVDAPFTLPEFVADTEIDATFIGGDPVQLSLAIYKANEILLNEIVEMLDCADDLNQQGIYNFLADLQDRFSKWHWQLGAVIGNDLRNAFATDIEEVGEVHDPAQPTDEMPADMNMPDMSMGDVQVDAVRFIDPTQVAVLAKRGERVTKGIERRQIVRDLEIRQEGDGMTLRGYAAVFNSPSQPLPFTETIAQGAFRDSLNSRNDVKLLWNHDTGTVLGSTRAGTLKLSEDTHGLLVEANLPDTQAGRDAATLIKRGDVNAFSFGFRVATNGDEWPSADQRILKRVNVHEVSLVAFPAYTATEGTASVRAMTELADKITRLAEMRGVSAEELTDALLALESGDELTERQGELLTDTLGKVLKQDPEVTNPAAVLDLKKKQLDLLMKRV